MTAEAPRLDFITENSAENVRRVQARDLGATVVQAIFRLAKQATLHSLDNQAVVRQVEDTAKVINDYGQRADQNVSVLFAFGSIFVGGQLLKANRLVYEGAVELGNILKKFGFSELAIARNVTPQDLFAFVSALAEANRASSGQGLEKPSPRVRMRAVADSALKRGATVERLDETQAVVRMYSSAIVIMRRFFEALQRGRYDLPQRVKRIAQVLVDLSQGETPAFLGVTAARNANQDEAGRAVNTAVLSVSMTRQVTDDIVILGRVAMAALLYDIARPRLTNTVGPNPPAIMPRLSEVQELEQPAASAAVLTALGHINEPTVMRTVLAYEAHWLRKQQTLGPVYGGVRPATMQARIVLTARRFNDLLTPAPGDEPMSADDAVSQLEADAREPADQTVLRLLVACLGIFPTGTLVQLGSGEMGLVVQTPSHPAEYSLPRVRVMFDASGGRLAHAADIDLAKLATADPRKRITQIVSQADEASRAQAKAARMPTTEQPSHRNSPSQVSSQGSAPSSPFTPSAVSAPLAPRPAPSNPTNPSLPPAIRTSGTFPAAHARTPTPAAVLRTPTPAAVLRTPTPAPQTPVDPNDPHAVYAAQYAEWQRQQAEYEQKLAEYNAAQTAYQHSQAPEAELVEEPEDLTDAGFEGGVPTRAVTREAALAAEEHGDDGQSTRVGDAAAIAAALRASQEVELDDRRSAPVAGHQRSSAPAPEPQPTPAPAPEPPVPPTPTAEGTLTKTPLVHLLVYMLDQRLTGTALFQTPEGINHGIYFDRGIPAKARTGGMIAPLDRVLLSMGLLDERTLRESLLEVSKKKVLHGRYLVGRGLLDGTTVLKVLKEQLQQKLIVLFDMAPETQYAFFADMNLLENYGGPELTPVEPLSLIMTGVRMRSDDPLVQKTLDRLATRPLGLHPQAEVKRFDFRKEEASVIDLLRIKKMSLDEILSHGVAHESTARLTIYVMAITRHLEIAGAQGKAPIGITERDRVRRSGVVEPGPVAIREGGSAPSAPPAQESRPPDSQGRGPDSKGLGIDFSRMTPKPGGMVGMRPGEEGSPAPSAVSPMPSAVSSPPPGSGSGPPPLAPFAPSAAAQAYAAPSDPGYPPPPQASYPAAPQASYPAAPQAGYPPPPSPRQAYEAAPQQQQYAAAPQQQYAAPPQQQYEPAPQPQQYGAAPQQQYEPAPQQQYAAPPQQQYAAPPQQQYEPAPQPQQYGAAPQQQYEPAPQQQQYAAPPQQYAPPPQAYAPPAQSYEPPPQQYAPPPQAYAPPPQPQAYAPPPQPAFATAAPAPGPFAAGPPAAYGGAAQAGAGPSSQPRPAQSVAPQPGAGANMVGGGGAQPRKGPPGHLSNEHKYRWQEIELRAARADKENYYEMLEIEPNATDPQVQAAFFKLAKQWHPDRLPAELAELRPLVSKTFTMFNEAYATLSDPSKRLEYQKSIDIGGGTSEEAAEVQRVVDAALEFQKAEVLLKKGDLVQAEQYARVAAAADPDQIEYTAFLAWVQALKRGDPPIVPEGRTSTFYDDVLATLDQVLIKDPMYERALYFRAVLLKRAGKEDKAIRDFRLVVQLNPKNIDAVREMRLFQMRKERKKKEEGLLGKFFKK